VNFDRDFNDFRTLKQSTSKVISKAGNSRSVEVKRSKGITKNFPSEYYITSVTSIESSSH
jgi:hypothetical protein